MKRKSLNVTARKKKCKTLSVERKITKTPFPKTKLARCTGKGVAFKTNVELKTYVKL